MRFKSYLRFDKLICTVYIDYRWIVTPNQNTSSDWLVVICLKNRTFAVYKTTLTSFWNCTRGCDLLEKSYLCGIQNNFIRLRSTLKTVVICLKNRTFAVYKTTLHWFLIYPSRCDLLEKSYLCGIQNNPTNSQQLREVVVICLKNRTFAVYKTTK